MEGNPSRPSGEQEGCAGAAEKDNMLGRNSGFASKLFEFATNYASILKASFLTQPLKLFIAIKV